MAGPTNALAVLLALSSAAATARAAYDTYRTGKRCKRRLERAHERLLAGDYDRSRQLPDQYANYDMILDESPRGEWENS